VERAGFIHREVCADLNGIESRRPSRLPLEGAVPIMITLLLLEAGTPHYLTNDSPDLWISPGTSGRSRECGSALAALPQKTEEQNCLVISWTLH
jgi:hypothetical protein